MGIIQCCESKYISKENIIEIDNINNNIIDLNSHNSEKIINDETNKNDLINIKKMVINPKEINYNNEEIKENNMQKSNLNNNNLKNNINPILNFLKKETDTKDTNTPKKKTKKIKKDIEEILEKFNDENIIFIKNLFIENNIINANMDNSTINLIINCIKYLKIKKDVEFYNNLEKNDMLFIVKKGRINLKIGNKEFNYGKNTIINTKLLKSNNENFSISVSTNHSYIFSLKYDKYHNIITDFYKKFTEEKIENLKKIYLFAGFERKNLNYIADKIIIYKCKERKEFIKEGTNNTSLFILLEGVILITKNEQIIKKCTNNNFIFGEICFFEKNAKNFFSYFADTNTEIYEINFEILKQVFNNYNYIDIIIKNIFLSSLKNCEILNKYYSNSNIDNLINLFTLKYYYNNEIIINKHQTKIFLYLSGLLFTNINNQKVQLNLKRGTIVQDSLVTNNLILSCYEGIIFEANWFDILKSIKFYTMKNFTLYEIINLVKNKLETKFNKKNLSEIKLLHIAESIKLKKFSKNEEIIKNGPCSDKYYIIISGSVSEQVDNIEIKVLKEQDSFGDIINSEDYYQIRPSYYAKGNVSCFIIEKEKYENIIEEDFFKNFNSNNSDDESSDDSKSKKNSKEKVQLEQLYYVKDLGQGAYGKVYLVNSYNNKKYYAIKTAELQAMAMYPERAKYYNNEKSILSNLNFIFICKLYATFKTREYIFFLLEYIHGYTMRNILDNFKKSEDLRNLKEVQFYAVIISLILDYLQNKRIIHRDLKLNNLIMDDTGYLKIIDFGIAKDITGKDKTNTIIGTYKYMAPEMIKGNAYSFNVDYWAMGIILYEWFYGKVPFGYGIEDPTKIYKDICERNPIFPSDVKNEKFNDFLKNLLVKKPKKRYTNIEIIKKHPFFNDIDFDKVLKHEIIAPYIPKISNIDDENNNEMIQTPFTEFMKNHVFCSSTELDELIEKNKKANDLFSDF